MSLTNYQSGHLDVSEHTSVFWEAHGNPNGKPVLLIHGGSGHTFDLEKIDAFDPNEYFIVTWHQRGEGNSALDDPENAPLFSNVHDAEKLREHLEIDQWHIFSWSFGAIYMTAYGCLHPERCLSFTSHAPFLGDVEDWDVMFDDDPARAQAFLDHYQASGISEAKREAFKRAVQLPKEAQISDLYKKAVIFGYDGTEQDFRQSKTDDEWDIELKRVRMREKLYDETMNQLGSRWLFQLSHENTEFKSIPTTLLFGDNDQWVAPNPNTWFVYPYATQQMIEGVGHDVHDPGVQSVLRFVVEGHRQIGFDKAM